jgi:hypothetical protein
MKRSELSTALVKRHIEDADRVFIAPDCAYDPKTDDHRKLWPNICAAIGERGAWYSTVRAVSGQNKNYAAYLIGALRVLRVPSLEQRLGIDGD